MEVRILGALEVRLDHGPPPALGGVKQRSVLAMLALHANTPVNVDVLAEGVWGDEVPPRFAQNLQVYVSTLRRLLEPARTAAMPSRIAARGPGYELALAPDEFDLARFRALVDQGTEAIARSRPTHAVRLLRSALELWRGEPCADLAFQPFTASMTRGLLDERWAAFERTIEAELAAGADGDLCGELEAALAEQPLREVLWEYLAVSLYRAGRQADALAACRRARTTLLDELGLDPGPRLREVEQQILEHAPELLPRRRAAIRAAHVPVPLNALIGRDELVAQVVELLGAERLVVLTGPGGMGKTRVALAVAAAIERPVVFADLSNVRESEQVVSSIAVALDTADRVDEIADRIEADGTLLVVDNFEQVVSAADVLGSIVARAPAARMIVTSRIRLGLPGERVLEVPPLSMSDGDGEGAVRLFCERALDADPSLDLAAHEVEVAAVCRAVDCSPLAIELAASRLRVLPLGDLARGVGAAIRGGSRRDQARRHGSMHAAIKWSTDLLDDDERRVFAGLSICEGPVDLPTVRAIAAAFGLDEIEADAALETLAEASLVRVVEAADGRRFAFLETIRAAAQAMLDGEAEELARTAHTEWFVARALTDGVDGDQTVRTVPTATTDVPNTAKAVRWLTDHGQVDRAGGAVLAMYQSASVGGNDFRVVHQLTQHILASGGLGAERRAQVQVLAGGMAYVTSDPRAEELLESVDHLAEDDFVWRARGSMWRAVHNADEGNLEGAAQFAADARAAAAASGQRRLIGLSWSASAYAALAADDAAESLLCANERLRVEVPGSVGHVNALLDRARALIELGQFTEALASSQEALSASFTTGALIPRADAYHCITECALLLGDVQTAAACELTRLDLDVHGEMVDWAAEVALCAAIALALVDRVEDGRNLWARGMALLHEHGVPVGNNSRQMLRLAADAGVDGGSSATAPTVAALLRDVRTRFIEVANASTPAD